VAGGNTGSTHTVLFSFADGGMKFSEMEHYCVPMTIKLTEFSIPMRSIILNMHYFEGEF
jgi:hypothetical protein